MKALVSLVLAAALAALAALPAAAAPQGRVYGPDQCDGCGTVSSIDPIQRAGQSSGKGAVIGAVIGGVVGHQFGSGKGNDAATAAGAVGGAVAGNQVEKNRNPAQAYRVTVDMDGGGRKTIDVPALNGLSTGVRVKVVGNNLQPISG